MTIRTVLDDVSGGGVMLGHPHSSSTNACRRSVPVVVVADRQTVNQDVVDQLENGDDDLECSHTFLHSERVHCG